ncbi:MAG: sigma-54 dependent transcriptional regulator [Proteobacteria bacterium]|nr:sigma-54-dependent Fis family transcriptional regulator [Desulfobulbaceae bacterium]MBU4153444.1 sigma-54 dependent transcriptional regulator [Pseudomonadota bacterium]
MSDNKDLRILVVDDEVINLQNISHILNADGYSVATAPNGMEAIDKISRDHFDLIITDLKMADIDGVQVMEAAQNMLPEAEVIIVTGYATVNSAVDAMAKGAFYYLPKPIKLKELRILVKKALEKVVLKNEITRLKQRIMAKKGVTQFVGHNSAILKLKDDIAQVAQLDCNVLIHGETGTGKELVARTIYELSPRANKRFLPINCAALNEELMLNELFGHEKDAFTGASKGRKGLLESADEGVVLLDEIGEIPVTMQVKLLRVLQEKKIIRVGGTTEIPIDIRIVAATNKDLQDEVKAGRFRQDLYYRLNVVSLNIPPLRDRKDDIPQLVRHFLAKYPIVDNTMKSITTEALTALQEYDYPGNVRELENIIERSLAMSNEPEIKLHHLPQELNKYKRISTHPIQAERQTCSLEENERDHILSVLKTVEGNKTKAANVLGIDRVSLWRKLKKYQEG